MYKMIEALRSGTQADADGSMVIVSRQACEEAADEIEQLRRKNEHLLSCINGISRQCADMVKANQ
jgi:hypothetical protein